MIVPACPTVGCPITPLDAHRALTKHLPEPLKEALAFISEVNVSLHGILSVSDATVGALADGQYSKFVSRRPPLHRQQRARLAAAVSVKCPEIRRRSRSHRRQRACVDDDVSPLRHAAEGVAA